MTQQRSEKEQQENEWHRGACIYQIYPRSFLDTGGDGIGDLPGITQKLDYIASLGIDGIWISPFFTSPMKDFGYDVANYRDVDPIFGTLDDFKILLAKAHRLNLKIIIDLVLSHTSDQHPWFTESRTSHDNPKADWYVWADPRPDMFGERVPPNNWVSVFGGPAWTFDETRGQYYLHNFLKEQPDLNFHNPDVQNAMLDICKFWLDLGVDGFRLDVVNFYFHDQELRDNPPRSAELGPATQFEGDDPYSAQNHIYDKTRPENLVFLERLRTLTNNYDNRALIGEGGDDHFFQLADTYCTNNRLHTMYTPQLCAGKQKRLTADLISHPVIDFLEQAPNAFPMWAFSNHDVVRAASRWCPDSDGFGHNPALSKTLIALLGCLQGSFFLYQGEELGLPEAKLEFEDLQDPWGKHLWPDWQGRDGCRTPLPWNNETNAGFTTAEPWLPIAKTHPPLNAEKQDSDPASTLNFTRAFLGWRKHQSALIFGAITFIETGSDTLLAFERKSNEQTLLCIFNLKDTSQTLPPLLLPENIKTVFPAENQSTGSLPPYSFQIWKYV
ncbi:MAG: alpha-glucosidase [Rhodospirillales bacterium]|nr:alpha-glucosidase [Alphaproteobacteria bacterium]MCB9981154.1 alpha-glucosidase [Rhodospirillales bacterium]